MQRGREKERDRERERDSFGILYVHTGYLLSIVRLRSNIIIKDKNKKCDKKVISRDLLNANLKSLTHIKCIGT